MWNEFKVSNKGTRMTPIVSSLKFCLSGLIGLRVWDHVLWTLSLPATQFFICKTVLLLEQNQYLLFPQIPALYIPAIFTALNYLSRKVVLTYKLYLLMLPLSIFR